MLALKLGTRGAPRPGRRAPEGDLPASARRARGQQEPARILQSVGAGPSDLPTCSCRTEDGYEWRAADGTAILRLPWGGVGLSGWNNSPTSSTSLPWRRRSTRRWPTSTPSRSSVARRPWRTSRHSDGVVVELQDTDGASTFVQGRYVVGADGANSVVRTWIGSEVTDLGYFHDWLVVDLVPRGSSALSSPAWQQCDPARPTTLVPGGPGRRRFEFMRLPDETREELNEEAARVASARAVGCHSRERHPGAPHGLHVPGALVRQVAPGSPAPGRRPRHT